MRWSSHKQTQPRDNWTQSNSFKKRSSLAILIKAWKAAKMAKLSNGFTSTTAFLLLTVAVCSMLVTSSSGCSRKDQRDLYNNTTILVSYWLHHKST